MIIFGTSFHFYDNEMVVSDYISVNYKSYTV